MILAETTFLGFFAAALLIELTPGPNMAYLAILAAGRGVRPGLAAVAGVALGLLLVGAASAIGAAALISQSRIAWQTLRWAGAAYLLWLAWEGWRGGAHDRAVAYNEAEARTLFLRGLTTNLLNPKAYLFYIAVLPRFTSEAGGSLFVQLLALSLVYVSVATAVHAAVVIGANWLRRLLIDDVGMTRLRRLLSVLLALVAVWLLWETR